MLTSALRLLLVLVKVVSGWRVHCDEAGEVGDGSFSDVGSFSDGVGR